MMKYSIDFSIFASPTEAFGNATGELQFHSPPVVGQVVELVDGKGLTITSLNPDTEGRGGTVVGLDDIVCATREEAREFANRLEAEFDLFVVPYHDKLP